MVDTDFAFMDSVQSVLDEAVDADDEAGVEDADDAADVGFMRGRTGGNLEGDINGVIVLAETSSATVVGETVEGMVGATIDVDVASVLVTVDDEFVDAENGGIVADDEAGVFTVDVFVTLHSL